MIVSRFRFRFGSGSVSSVPNPVALMLGSAVVSSVTPGISGFRKMIAATHAVSMDPVLTPAISHRPASGYRWSKPRQLFQPSDHFQCHSQFCPMNSVDDFAFILLVAMPLNEPMSAQDFPCCLHITADIR